MLSGAGLMQQESGLSINAVRIIQALVLLFVAADVIVRTIFRVKRAEALDASTPRQVGSGWGADVKRLRFGRRQTIGVLFGLLGVFLIGYVAGNLEPADKGLTLRAAARSAQDHRRPAGRSSPRSASIFVLVAVATFFERRSAAPGAAARSCSSTVLLVPLVIVLSLALSDTPRDERDAAPRRSRSRLGTPIALGAMAGLWCERSGVVNIGIEGMMLFSAATGFLTYAVVGDGTNTSASCGSPWGSPSSPAGCVALLHALLSVTYRVDQIISGVVINLLALGLTGFLRSEVIIDTGVATGIPTPTIGLPLLSDLPIVGDQIFTGAADLLRHVRRRRPDRAGPVAHPLRAADPLRRRAPARRRDARHRPDPDPLQGGGDRRPDRRARRAPGSRSSRRPASRTT